MDKLKTVPRPAKPKDMELHTPTLEFEQLNYDQIASCGNFIRKRDVDTLHFIQWEDTFVAILVTTARTTNTEDQRYSTLVTLFNFEQFLKKIKSEEGKQQCIP